VGWGGGGRRGRQSRGRPQQLGAAGRGAAVNALYTDPELTVHPQERGRAQLRHTAGKGLDQALQQPRALHPGGLWRVVMSDSERSSEAQIEMAGRRRSGQGPTALFVAYKHADGLSAKLDTHLNYNVAENSPTSFIGQSRALLGLAAPAACR